MAALDLAVLDVSYNEHGWVKTNLPDFECLRQIRDAIEGRLRKICGNDSITLETYHEYVTDEQHTDVQWELVNFFWDNDFSLKIGQRNYSFFRAFIGPDLHIQRRPYLRIARPNLKSDNIGYHRDTFYGQSPFEVTVHVPFVDLDAKGCMKFMEGSHIAPESAYDIVAGAPVGWTKGSRKHEMGFPYQPKKIASDLSALMPIPLKFGEAMVFTPALIHGQEVNEGPHTRFSVDLRIVSTFAPIKIRDDLSSRGYSPLAESAIAAIARKYANNCAAADKANAPA